MSLATPKTAKNHLSECESVGLAFSHSYSQTALGVYVVLYDLGYYKKRDPRIRPRASVSGESVRCRSVHSHTLTLRKAYR